MTSEATNGKAGEGDASKASGSAASNFIREIIEDDRKAGKHKGRVATRFPPEPNGYLHIGHAKSICLNFGLAREFGGKCNLRFDDTNPTTEDMEYVEAIQRDVKWLGFDWGDGLYYASGYYEKLYELAVELIKRGKAYVCSLSEEDIRKYRGSVTEPGTPSPYRDRSVEENLDLFRRMRAGEFPDGAHVLRAKIDMASPNMKMRDLPLYRIRHATHYKTGDAWCIYPLYDFAHSLSDWIEGVTHSLCTLEFENNREVYDWFLQALDLPERPQQIEFARLNLTSTVMSKRKLLELVSGKHVSGWDDPRMPTIAGLRRRGVTPEAIRELCERVGVAKNNSTVELALFEHVLREDLDRRSPRVLAVLRPLRVVIENYPEGQVEELEAPYFPPEAKQEGSRKLPFSRVLYIDRDDFMEDPPKDFFRLAPGKEVRLRYAYVIRCTSVVKDEATGEIVELRCSYDPETRGDGGGGSSGAGGRKVKGTIHWVSAEHAHKAEVRLYDRLFLSDAPGSSGGDVMAELNPNSLVALRDCLVEPSLAKAGPGEHFQFERLGFFFTDPVDSKPGAPVFSRTVQLKDTWAKKGAGTSAGASASAGTGAGEKAQAKGKAKEAGGAQAPKAEAQELSPEAKRLADEHGVGAEEARILAGDAALSALFSEALAVHQNAKAIARWIVNEVGREAKGGKARPYGGAAIGELIGLVDAGTISGSIAKEIFAELAQKGGSAKDIVARIGGQQISDAASIEPIIDAVLAENADAVARYKAGNQNLFGAFVGMAMKKSGGKANPKLLNELLRKKLQAS